MICILGERGQNMSRYSRRDFLKTTAGVAGVMAAGGTAVPVHAAKKSATDMVTLGNSGVQVTRLALGTGTFAGRVCASTLAPIALRSWTIPVTFEAWLTMTSFVFFLIALRMSSGSTMPSPSSATYVDSAPSSVGWGVEARRWAAPLRR